MISSGNKPTADFLAFPHFSGIFDWPSNVYLPIMLPELTVGDNVFIPAFYGRRCVTGLGMRKSFYFRYEQPDWINSKEQIISGIGSCKVSWTFTGNKVTSEFIFSVKTQVQLDHFCYALAISAPHSTYRLDSSPMLGPQGLRCMVEKDDFQGVWDETEVVTNDPTYRTAYGNIHYIQKLVRDHPLTMRPGHVYRLVVSFEPDIVPVKS